MVYENKEEKKRKKVRFMHTSTLTRSHSCSEEKIHVRLAYILLNNKLTLIIRGLFRWKFTAYYGGLLK